MTAESGGTPRGLIVLRKSRGATRDDQTPDVLAKHRHNLTRLCDNLGIQYDILEEIISGALSHKPGQILDRAIAMFDEGRYACVVCEDIDRLARPDLESNGRIVNTLIEHNIRIITPYTEYDPQNPDHIMQLKVKFFFADIELDGIKRRANRSRETVRRTTGCYPNGHAPFGYRWLRQEKRYEPDEYYPVVEYIFRACRQKGASLICRDIEQQFGLTMRRRNILFILTNPFYCGYPCQREVWVRGNRQRLREDDWIWPEKPPEYPCPVTRDEWRSIRSLMSQRANGRLKPASDYWASRILRCPLCGRALYGTDRSYKCTFAREQGENCEFGKVGMRHVHRALFDALREIAGTTAVQDDVLDKLVQDMQEGQGRRKVIESEIDHQLTIIAELERKRLRLLDVYLDHQGDDAYAKAHFQERDEQIGEQLRIAQAEKNRLDGLLDVPAVDISVIPLFRSIVGNLEGIWEVLTSEEKRTVCDLVFKRVELVRVPYMANGRQAGWRKTVRITELHEPFATLIASAQKTGCRG